MLCEGMQVLLATKATNVLDLYAVKQKAAQKGAQLLRLPAP